MAEKTPVRVNFDGSNNPTGFAEFQSTEYVGLDDGGTGGSYASLSALLEGLGLGTSDAPTFAALQTSGNVVIGGNLQVDGTTTTVNSTTVTIDDPIFTLGGDTAPASDDSKDRGIEFRWHNGTTAKLGFFGFDDSTGKFTFIPDATNAAEVFSGTAGTIVANLEGNVTGTVSSLSGLTTDDLTEGSSNFYYTDERVDDRVNALIVGGAGVDTAYDDAAGTLTLTADLSEITTDLNERIDDQVAALLVDSNTSGIDISYDDVNGQLTISSDLSEVVEALQDNVQGLFVGGTGVTSAYDDASNSLTLSIDFSEFDSDNIVEGSTNLFVTNERIDDRVNALLTDATTSGIDISYDDAGNSLTLSVDLSEIVESLQDNVQGLFSGGTGITTSYDDAANTLSLSIDFSEFDTDNLTEGSTNLFHTTERVQDVVGGQIVTNGSHTGISFAYDDANDGAIDATVSLASFDTDNLSEGSSNLYFTDERAQDAVGGMLTGNTETLITATYDDTNAKINLVVDNDLANYSNTNSAFITLTSLSGSTGVTYDNSTGAISIGQAVGTTDNVTFNNVTVDGTLTSDDITSTNISVAGNATITGNLTVEGTTTTVDSTTVAVGDGMFKFAKDNTGNSTDVGFYGKIVQSSTTKYVGMHWDAGGVNKFKLFDGLTVEPTGTVDTADASYNTATLVADIEGDVTGNLTGNVTGNLTGNVTGNTSGTAGSLASAQNFSLTGDVTATAVSFDGTGAVALATTIASGAVEFGMVDGAAVITSTETIASNSTDDTSFPTTKAVFDYVSAIDVDDDLTVTDGTTSTVINLDSDTLTIQGTSNEVDVSNTSGTFTIGLPTSITVDVSGDLTGNVTATSVLADGVTATTQTAGDNSTKVATTAYVDAQVATEDTLAELNDTNITSPADGALLFYDTGTSMWIDNVVSGDITIADTGVASVSQSAVTQHQAALSITESQITDLGSYITATSSDTLTGKTINFEDNTAIIEFAVTVSNASGNNKYYLDGELSANIQLIPGVTYRFDQSDSSNSGHPLVLSTTSESAGVTSYTTGVTTNGTPGSAGAYTQIVVDGATADKLYYYCSNHSGMGGGIVSIQGSSFVAGTGISISGETISTTITQYADSDVEAYLSGGTGVTFSSGSISIGQAVGTTDNVQFNNVQVDGTLTSDDITSTNISVAGNATITGNLTVQGTTTTIDSNTVNIGDNMITLNADETGTPTLFAGIEVERGTSANKNLIWNETQDKWTVGSETFVAGTFEGALTGNASTATALATGRTIGMTGDVVWTSASFDGSGDVTGTATIQSGAIETAMLNANIITGQSTYSGTVDTTNDFVLLYDASSTSLTKIAVSDLNAASGAGTMTDFTIAGDSGSNQTIADSNVLTFTGGTGISTSIGGTDTVTFDLDSTATASFAGLTLTSTDAGSSAAPTIELYRNSASPANADYLGELKFFGETSTGAKELYASITGKASDVTNGATDGTIEFMTVAGGSNNIVARLNENGMLLTEGMTLKFEGATNDSFETTFTVTDPTADRTVTLPDATGTVILSSSSIGDLSDVDITTSAPTNGQALVWNATNSEFEPGTVASSTNLFQTIAVSGQSNIVADSTTDTLNFAAGANITLTTDASTDTVTIAATGGAANAFSTLAVAGQSDVVADSETDTLTLVEGTGMTITTDASTDTITFNSSGGGGTLSFTDFDGTTDNIVLSSTATAGQLPVTLAGGTSDPIEMSATTATLTSYADGDNDTSVEVERTTDNDTVHIKAGGTDVITATSSGVTITNLTVTGTTTQANELKITDTLFELNADGGSLTTDAGMIVERGSTGDNAAFIWDESTDSWVAGTTATDGSAAANLTVTEGTLKAATQSQGDNSTNVATTAYVDTATAGISSDSIKDADNDTKIEAEASSDADELVFTTGGQERAKMDNNMSMSARGGFFTHNLAMHASETFTIASTEGTVAAGPLDIQGTVDVQGSLVVL